MKASASIALWIQPRSRRNEVVGMRDDAVVIRLTAPPVDGAANEALRSFVAERLGIAPSRVALVRGQSSRRKWIAVEGLSVDRVRCALLGVSHTQ
ncbi:DUF167 domain-containing protein [Synechococcus sp. J7-Johnson]|uniref:DUF167 domain-containing protein n=1 Tax=Synechococcus sp. J7-Johnson TaxID=2823737 RepID=UPI0020CE6AFA|nr:DUF167 domain-containing protein [Synechococcus sp. J7-Johnson]MCP9841668.1 DUF167 domain-containing protein [Synechococcus sp. J7-Johnson]